MLPNTAKSKWKAVLNKSKASQSRASQSHASRQSNTRHNLKPAIKNTTQIELSNLLSRFIPVIKKNLIPEIEAELTPKIEQKYISEIMALKEKIAELEKEVSECKVSECKVSECKPKSSRRLTRGYHRPHRPNFY